eukprot:scaffold77680_cov18-Tisochrysis_lutea.AAC.1
MVKRTISASLAQQRSHARPCVLKEDECVFSLSSAKCTLSPVRQSGKPVSTFERITDLPVCDCGQTGGGSLETRHQFFSKKVAAAFAAWTQPEQHTVVVSQI